MPKADKTHAMRALDARRIPYRALEYDPAAEFHTGADAAALLAVDPASVYKTLVVLREEPPGRPLLAMIPVAEQLDLKVLAKALGARRLRMATLREAERLTGMQAGGISALALQRPVFDVVIDESARSLDEVHVSAGRRGLDLAVSPADLVAVSAARWVVACQR
jgi:Cys-tRNA(Pro)/Cys-tRNA(Cys) deacylase